MEKSQCLRLPYNFDEFYFKGNESKEPKLFKKLMYPHNTTQNKYQLETHMNQK